MAARVFGPVWRSLPQTPQVAEFCAYAAAVQLVAGKAVIFDDCSNVVRTAKLGIRQALSGRSPHAGIFKSTLQWEGRKYIEEVVKVKAHVSEHSMVDPTLKRHARGNTFADEAANLGRDIHPVLARNDTSVEAYVSNLEAIGCLIARSCKLWPKARTFNGTLQRLVRPTVGPPPAVQRRGPAVGAAPSVRPHGSHYLMQSGNLVFCGICGAYQQYRSSAKLTSPCGRRVANSKMAKQRDNLMSGVHPVSGCAFSKVQWLTQ